jgi:hypothetical protein
MKKFLKKDYPLSDIRRYLEPGPIVLVSSAWQGKSNIMTTLIDEHTKQCLATHVGWSVRAVDVITVIEASIQRYGALMFSRKTGQRIL